MAQRAIENGMLAVDACQIFRREIHLAGRDLERLADVAFVGDRKLDRLPPAASYTSTRISPTGAARGIPTTAIQAVPSRTTSARCPSASTRGGGRRVASSRMSFTPPGTELSLRQFHGSASAAPRRAVRRARGAGARLSRAYDLGANASPSRAALRSACRRVRRAALRRISPFLVFDDGVATLERGERADGVQRAQQRQ